MLAEHKNFKELEAEIRESFSPLLSVREIRSILGCSVEVVIDLIKAGKLDAFHLDGTAVDRDRIGYGTYGLRVPPSSLRDYMEAIRVK
jgi:hypothetical protein